MNEKKDDFGFKFQIGQMVTTVFNNRGIAGDDSWLNSSVRAFIVERTLQQCPGGIQRHYVCRLGSGMNGDCGKDLGRFNEIELKEIVEEKKPA